jgi:hypothetical protein
MWEEAATLDAVVFPPGTYAFAGHDKVQRSVSGATQTCTKACQPAAVRLTAGCFTHIMQPT